MRTIVLAATLAALSGAARAEMTLGDCEALRDAAPAFLGLADAQADIALDGGACVFSDVVLSSGERNRPDVTVERISLRLDDTDALLTLGRPPHDIVLTVENARVVNRFDDSAFDYAYRAQSYWNTFDGSLRARWLADDRRLVVDEMAVDAPGPNGFSLSGEIAGIDLTSQGSMLTTVGSMGLTRLDATIESQGIFEILVLTPLVGLLTFRESTAEASIDETLAMAAAGIEAAPQAILPDAGKAALIAVLDDFPNPGGSLRLTLDADPGLGMPRLARFAINGAPQTAEAFWAAFSGVTLDVSYDRVRVE